MVCYWDTATMAWWVKWCHQVVYIMYELKKIIVSHSLILAFLFLLLHICPPYLLCCCMHPLAKNTFWPMSNCSRMLTVTRFVGFGWKEYSSVYFVSSKCAFLHKYNKSLFQCCIVCSSLTCSQVVNSPSTDMRWHIQGIPLDEIFKYF